MRNEELKMKFGQRQEEISKPSLPISADLSNDFKSILLETDQRKISPFMRLFWEGSKNIYNILKIMLHITPWTLILMLHVRQSIYLVLTNVLSTSFLMFHIHLMKLAQHCLYNSGKGKYTRYIEQWYVHTLELHFCYFFMKIGNVVY